MEFHISPLEWEVFKHYEVVDGMVQGFGSITNVRKYYPFEQLELPNALAKIDPDNEEEILEFVHRYGILGGSQDDHGFRQEPESLEWIQHQIKTMKLLLNLVKCSRDDDEETAVGLCKEIEGIEKDTLVIRTDAYDVPSNLTKDAPLGWVRYYACAIINDNIKGVTRKAAMLPNGKGVKSEFYFSCMLDAIYWNVLNAFESADIGRCEECGTPFIKTDGRQRFCPKQYLEKESKCGMRYHQEQRRIRLEKQKQNA